eukprot:173080-Chlamydomonas_euryale.AAC.1
MRAFCLGATHEPKACRAQRGVCWQERRQRGILYELARASAERPSVARWPCAQAVPASIVCRMRRPCCGADAAGAPASKRRVRRRHLNGEPGSWPGARITPERHVARQGGI